MKDDTSTPTPEDNSPNTFERDKAGTADRSRAEAAIEELRRQGDVRPRGPSHADVTRRVETEDEIAFLREAQILARERERELRTMTKLHDLGDKLLGTTDLHSALGEVLDAALEVVGSDRGTLQILDPVKGVLRYAATRSFDEKMLATVPPIKSDFHSTCAACIRTRERVVAGDIASDPTWADHACTAAALGYGAAFSTPMKTRRDELLGVVTIHFEEPYIPSETELRWTDLFARMAAHLIERARAEEALRQSEERYRTLFDSIDEGFCIAERVPGAPIDFRYVAVNPSFERQTGIANAVGRTMREVVPEVEESNLERYARVADGGVSESFTASAFNREYQVEALATGRTGQVAMLFRDITVARRAERTLRESEERQRFLLKFSDELRTEPDADAVANRAIRLLMEELQLDRCYITFYRPDDDEADFPYQVGNESVPPLPEKVRLSDFPEAYAQVLDRTFVLEDDFERRGLSEAERENSKQLGMRAMVASTVRRGKNNPICSMAAVSASPRGWTIGEIALVEEVAERTWAAIERARAEEALRQSEEKYRSLFESMDEGYMLADVLHDDAAGLTDIRFVEANPAAVRIAGRDFTGQRMREIDPEYEDFWYELYSRVASTGQAVRAEHYAKPHGRWFEFHISKFGNGHSHRVAVVFQDVTERKRSEEALRESEERLAAELENAKALQRMSGLLITDGETDRLFEQIVDTAISMMRADFGSIQLMDAERGELRLVASRNFSPEAEAYWQRASGIVAVQSTPLTGRDGTIIGMISTHWREPHVPDERELRLFDVLVRQAADFIERRRAEEALQRSERHANVLLAELQHRVRNTLAVVRSIARRTALNSATAEDMLAHFQGRLDAFSRVQAALTRSANARVDLASLIEEELVAHAAREGRQVQIEGPLVMLEPKAAERLGLAIHELTTNAVKHGALIDGEGELHIRWHKRSNGGGRELVLEWVESGVELEADRVKRDGFGMELLRRTLPYDLGAETKVDLTPTGLQFELRVPLPEELAA